MHITPEEGGWRYVALSGDTLIHGWHLTHTEATRAAELARYELAGN